MDEGELCGPPIAEEESIVGLESIVSEEDLQDLKSVEEGEDGEVIEEPKRAPNDDELDYEEEENDSLEDGQDGEHKGDQDAQDPKEATIVKKEEDEDGEVNSDDDLEEGEVKDDDDEIEEDLRPLPKKEEKRNTSHKPSIYNMPIKMQRFNYPPHLHPPRTFRTDDFSDHLPIFPHLAPGVPRTPPAHLAPPLLHPPPPGAESAWERGLRHAKEMLAKASKRKEEEVDFDDKRFNLGVDDITHSRHSHHSRNSEDSYSFEGSPRGRSPTHHHSRDKERRSRDVHYSSEYERRRRLAFESAPWNDEQSSTQRSRNTNKAEKGRESAEHYRDPWRRSKSPPSKWASRSRGVESSSVKKSHSMSSISGSDTGSNMSRSASHSVSEDSFSGSESMFSERSDLSRRSRDRKEKRDPDKTKGKNRPPHQAHASKDRNLGSSSRDRGSVVASKNKPSRSSIDEETSNASLKRNRIPPPAPRPRQDSWSLSDSASESGSESSVGSGSESRETDVFSAESEESEDERKTRGRRDDKRAVVQGKRSRSRFTPSPVREGIRKNKVMKSDKVNVKRHPSPPESPRALQSPPSPMVAHDIPQKKLIKMTFKKKHQSLKKDRNVTAKLNGSRDESEEDSEIAGRCGSDMGSDESMKEELKRELDRVKSSSSTKVSSTTDGSSSSKRDDLLKQLKAVEAAIRKKRAKLH